MTTTKSKRKQRGGWPKRKRESIIVRVDKGLADVLSDVARTRGVTRNQVIGDWLSTLARIAVHGGGGSLFELYRRLDEVLGDVRDRLEKAGAKDEGALALVGRLDEVFEALKTATGTVFAVEMFGVKR